MKIKGFQKSSFIDYPDKISAVIFTGGCNFRCGYCHNGELVINKLEALKTEEVFALLEKRKKYIDAVCISGGEPTLQKDLPEFLSRIKSLGFLVKLDTNGTNPDVLTELLKRELLDYIAMDIKAPLKKYRKITLEKADIEKIKRSVEIIKNSKVEYEFRTTVCKELISPSDILAIAKEIRGCRKYTIQNYRESENILSGKKYTPYKKEELEVVVSEIKDYFSKFLIRY